MIPHYLSLTNFLSYRDTAELELSGVHLACISGLNGAGKSSLLDAMTWALFGRGRSADDNVINRVAAGHGKAAEVTFIFELEGAVYRIIRRKPPGKTTQVELHVRYEKDGQFHWRAMTETGVRETQRKIDGLLHMQYDIFTNASFLLQGQADEFTTKTPNRRKEILADILGVSRWDDFKALATDRRKAAEMEQKLLDHRLADIDAELAQEETRRRELELAEAHEAAIVAQAAAQEALVLGMREKRARLDQQRAQLARTADELKRTQTELERLEREMAARRGELAAAHALVERAPAIEAAYQRYQATAATLGEWQQRYDQAEEIERHRRPLETAITRARDALEHRLRNLLDKEKEVADAAAEREQIAAQLDALRARRDAAVAQGAELATQQAAYHAARDRLQALNSSRALWSQERDRLAADADEAARNREQRGMIAASHEAAQTGLVAAQTALDALAEQEQRLADIKVERARLEADLEALRREGREQNARIESLQVQTGGDCPTCGQPLTEEHRESVLREWLDAREAMRERFRQGQERQGALDAEESRLGTALKAREQRRKERDTQQRALSNYTAQLRQIDALLAIWDGGAQQARLAELEALLADDDELAALQAETDRLRTAADAARQNTHEQQVLTGDIARLESRCEQLEKTAQAWAQDGRLQLAATGRDLDEQRYAARERQQLASLDAQLAAVGYDATAHAAARAALTGLSAAPEDHSALQQARTTVKLLGDTVAEQEASSRRAATRLVELRTRREEEEAALRELEAGVAGLRAAEAEQDRLRDERTAAARATGNARQMLAVLADQRRNQVEVRAERQALGARIAQLRQLEEACGRNGVQALLIETALPEIEEHANDLLYRLSGGEMRVRFDTQRDRKSDGGQIETLDIKISDGSGERPYENYSGGEKFRVNFAIRLALSQVLARRAGARLQTLVIDEGFGSQDPEGRQRLVEGINRVQDEFACILVITHIDELRDKFPARIEVEKTAAGSRLQLVRV